MTGPPPLDNVAAIIAAVLGLVFAWRGLKRALARFGRARWARRQRTRSDLLALSPNEFEAMTAAAFEARGWRVEIVGREGRPDGGLDLLLFKDGRKMVAQCKRYAGKVGAPVVRESLGVMIHHRAHGAYVVGLSGFTKAAEQWAKGKPLTLIDGGQLLKAVHRARRTR